MLNNLKNKWQGVKSYFQGDSEAVKTLKNKKNDKAQELEQSENKTIHLADKQIEVERIHAVNERIHAVSRVMVNIMMVLVTIVILFYMYEEIKK